MNEMIKIVIFVFIIYQIYIKNTIIQIISEDHRTFQMELDEDLNKLFSNKNIKIISDKNEIIMN